MDNHKETDILVAQRINPNAFNDLLVLPAGQSVHLSCEIA